MLRCHTVLLIVDSDGVNDSEPVRTSAQTSLNERTGQDTAAAAAAAGGQGA